MDGLPLSDNHHGCGIICFQVCLQEKVQRSVAFLFRPDWLYRCSAGHNHLTIRLEDLGCLWGSLQLRRPDSSPGRSSRFPTPYSWPGQAGEMVQSDFLCISLPDYCINSDSCSHAGSRRCGTRPDKCCSITCITCVSCSGTSRRRTLPRISRLCPVRKGLRLLERRSSECQLFQEKSELPGRSPAGRDRISRGRAYFSQGESILFGAFGCGKEPYLYLWWSDRDGILNSQESFSSSNLTAGWHTITLSVTDGSGRTASDSIELGVAPPSVCNDVRPRPRYYPVDTPCQDIWPNGTESCQEIEVCHPGLDYIVLDAVSCCNDTASSSPACAWALEHSGGDNKRCRGLYIIRAFGPDAVYMQGYALFKACCSGYPECTRTSWPSLAGTISFQEGFNQNVQNLSCRPEEWGVSAWHSDTNMSQNSAVLGLFPAHATVNILQTGVCIDYAAALTTALRKAGYSNTEAMVAVSLGYDLPLLGSHPGHAYNLVKLPGDDRYHIVDTTGNGDGINLDGLPRYFWFKGNFMNQPVSIRVFDWWVGYCTKMSQYGLNDVGSVKTPDSSELCGCS